MPLHYRFELSCAFDERVSARPRLPTRGECIRNSDAEIAGAATLDYRPRMHARHGQGAVAGQARPPRSKLSDFLHLWVSNIRFFYTWNNVNDHLTPQLSSTMGNLQSDGKKKQKKKDTTATAATTTATSASTEELDTDEDQKEREQKETEQKEQKRDQLPRVLDVRSEPREQIRISFEKVQTPGHTKRQAPQPPKIVLPKVPFFIF